MDEGLISGAPEGFDARVVAARVAAAKGPVLWVVRDAARLAASRDALEFFAPDLPVLEFPAWDCVAYDRTSPSPDVTARRVATLAALAGGFDRPSVVLTTLNALVQRVPPADMIAGNSFSARVGERVDIDGLRNFLVCTGFSQCATAVDPGDFAIRGGLIDIYPPGSSAPVRLDFFGDVLDGAREFDPMTQRTTRSINRLDLAAAQEFILDEASITRFRQNYRLTFGAAGNDDPLYEAVSAGRKYQGMEHWLPFFHDGLDTLLDYLPKAQILLDDRFAASHEARWDAISEQYAARQEAMTTRSGLETVYKPVEPQALYLDPGALAKAMQGHTMRQLSPLPQPNGPNVTDAGGRIGRNFAPERQAEDGNLFDAVASYLKKQRCAGPVLVASYSAGSAERMAGILEDHGLSGAKKVSRVADLDPDAPVHVTVWPLEAGFTSKDLTVISEQDILGDRLIRGARKRHRAENFLTEASSLSVGDLVVHVEHGIGRYTGLETVTAAGAPHECLALEYAEGARLYLPVENVELLSRYGHEEGLLDRLGGGAWQAKKAKLKERIRDMAERLIRIAAERALRVAPKLTPPDHLWDEFSARFPYEETDDQLNAIEDVLGDMASGHPMDRLVCGDVGFGKTEVALRAAFVAAMSGTQVAVITPTTLLTRQHFQSFAERFRGLPVKVRQLSRFVPAAEAEETRKGLTDGTVDIVVGTHALLAKSIKFNDLGLLIVDEEQKFGVTHKERLKQLRSEVHVLTLTATPIPRTLQMALSGVRELSLIGTPPVDRLAIRTYVSEFDTVTIREALLREHYRGGQSFFVVPRVADMAEMEEFLREQVPEVSFVTAHGQMAAGDLDKRMNAFYDGAYDVLLATTIIESGLDIPSANTLIVHRADMFGLAQLYQIRGRVGRSKLRAYAYFTTRARQKLTPDAEKRLRVLGSISELGAGFSLASQDLDLRGAGNLLGEEQSGQVREVGYELYQDMLEEAIAKMKAGEMEGLSEADEGWAPQINLGVPVLIPDDYVPDLDLRLGLYRRLSSLHTKVELEGFAAELIDRFGKLPKEVNMLMNIVRIKSLCKQAGIAKLDGGPKGAVIQFHKDKFANPGGLVEFIKAQKGQAKVRDNKVVVRRDWSTTKAKVQGAYAIAQDLAKLAKV
ncbi:transcription-repair coupling factor [Halovulum sp. GXIMD14793]